ncbi:hypothetical protein ACFY7A_18420 [Streptomyces longwoodensis]
MGRQFIAAEFDGGPIMIVLVAGMFRVFLRERQLRLAPRGANRS